MAQAEFRSVLDTIICPPSAVSVLFQSLQAHWENLFWALPDTPFPSWGVQDWAPTEMWAPSLPWHHIILRLPTLLCSEKLQQTESNLVLQENKVKYSTVPMNLFAGQQWGCRHRGQTHGHHGSGGYKERVGQMKRVDWKHIH